MKFPRSHRWRQIMYFVGQFLLSPPASVQTLSTSRLNLVSTHGHVSFLPPSAKVPHLHRVCGDDVQQVGD